MNPDKGSKRARLLPRNRLLAALHVVWVALAVLALGLFAFSIPACLDHLAHLISPAERVELAAIGLSVRGFVGYSVLLDVLTAAIFFLAAGGIFWRTAGDWVAALVSVALMTLGVAISPSLDALVATRPAMEMPVFLVRAIAVVTTLGVFYVFPDGRFVPRWMRTLAVIWVGWGLAWFLFPARTVDPQHISLPLRILSFVLSIEQSFMAEAYRYLRMSSLLLVLLTWFGTGVFAQIYRYTRTSTPVQRQQTKWIVFGLTAAFVGYFGFRLLPLLIPPLRHAGQPHLLYTLIGEPISTLFLLLAPLAFGVSVLKYRLWDIDPLIHRTLVYGALTSSLGVFYFGSVVLFQNVFRAVTGYQSTLAIAVSTLVIAAMVRPLRSRLQDFIDRRFYRERVDFRRAFTNFSREVRTLIELPELLHVLVERTTELLHITHGAVFLRRPDGTFRQAEEYNLAFTESGHPFCPLDGPPSPASLRPDSKTVTGLEPLDLDPQLLAHLGEGMALTRPSDSLFPLLVPLLAPQTEEQRKAQDPATPLVGILALGPRLSGQHYSREDQALLRSLADQAGTAIHVAQLVQDKQEEVRRREDAERHLEAYRNSPAGQAEAFAHTLLPQPETALVALHDLAQEAGQDPAAASVMETLPAVLENMEAGSVARLAEGYHYLFTARFAPEILPVGLRTLLTQLEASPDGTLEHAEEARATYRLCQAALEANCITRIPPLLPQFEEVAGRPAELLPELAHALAELQIVAESLHAYERLDTAQDKLAYLASAVERLGHVDHVARTDLEGADQAVAQRITHNWLAIVTTAMSELQTQARIDCRLLTRHTWQGDVISLALSLRNEGRGAALNLQVALIPMPEYTLVDEVVHIERLVPGEEARVEMRVRPHLEEGDRFRAHFVITYTDPRGPDQVENFADVVYLLAAEGPFQYIPNPYVVGTPLQAGSPLFFGREDVVAFVQENLSAHHRNNLVLIGQRRTGKTSLLKQLPVRLGEEYLPVYLDGQTLGLDPGLPNFFLTLATEIAFAMEDHGFPVELPELEDFTESPAASFEHRFLAGVRETIGERHLLITFDEFEELESAVQRGHLDSSVFGFLRHLIQHSERLSVIFCGTHRLEELASDYWSVLFNISLYQHIGMLKKPEALRLVQEPVAEYGMRYDDLTLDKMWRVTAGHPYFMQLLCHSLVNRHNRTRHSYVTVADLNAALDEILASGEAHFVYLWTEATPTERLALTALSRMVPLTGRATPVQVVDYFAERGVHVERRKISAALHHLKLREILESNAETDGALGEAYRWRLGLLGLWVEKYKSLSRVIDEVRE